MQQAAELSVAAPTIEAALDARFLSGAKDERVAASDFFEKKGLKPPTSAEVQFLLALLCQICAYVKGLIDVNSVLQCIAQYSSCYNTYPDGLLARVLPPSLMYTPSGYCMCQRKFEITFLHFVIILCDAITAVAEAEQG